MARQLQYRAIEVLGRALGRRVAEGPTPDWLVRPGRLESGELWRTVRLVYRRLTDGMELPDEAPLLEWRAVDGILGATSSAPRIVEVDESQHFNEFRALALRLYPATAALAFPRASWLTASERTRAIGGGGWAKPKPPLFPMAGGRHRQRAFRDTTADLLAPVHGWAPTLRIADFEVEPWIWDARGATAKMGALLEARLAGEA
jgi:hypothetical protein